MSMTSGTFPTNVLPHSIEASQHLVQNVPQTCACLDAVKRAMRRTGERVLLGSLLALAVTFTSSCFSAPRADRADPVPSSRNPKSEQRFAASARERGEAFLSRDEERLLKRIVRAGRRRDWDSAEASFWDYAGAQTPIYSAALDASIRCRRFSEGVSIYEEMCQRGVWRDLPTFSMALKIFSKSSPELVPQIWEEAVSVHALDAALCTARIDAAAEVGDVKAAQEVLEEMERAEPPLQPNLVHFTSVIRACTNADSEESHEMAKRFFELSLGQGVEPDGVLFRELIAAYRTAPLHEVQTVYAFMKDMGVEADSRFSDAYLRTVLRLPGRRKFQSLAEAASAISTIEEERLAEARAVLRGFKDAGRQATALGHLLDGALQRLQ